MITAANTFVATVGAIAEWVPSVFVDCNDMFCMAVNQRRRSPGKQSDRSCPFHRLHDGHEGVRIANEHNLTVVHARQFWRD